MTYILEQNVINEIERVFAQEHHERIKRQLNSTTLWAEKSGPPPRIHIAIIWLSKGNIGKFENELNNAASDWRDILLASGLAYEDWKEVLFNKGINCNEWSKLNT